jgi:hypothetical protein
MGILGKALAGAGQGAAIVGLEEFRNQAIAMRDARLAEISKATQERGFAHAEGMQQKGFEQQTAERTASEGFQRGMETEVRQPFQRERDESSQAHARSLQESDHQFRAGEGDKNRELDKRRIGLEGARLGLAQQQFKLASEQAKLAIESGRIELDQKKRLDEIYRSINDSSTPEQIEQAAQKLYAITGKDKFTAVHATNPLTGEVTMDAMDTRTGEFKSKKGATNSNDPFGLRQGKPAAPQVTPQSAPKAESKPQLILDNEFRDDAKTMTPQEFVKAYEGVPLNFQQQLLFDQVKKKVPPRALPFGRT